MRICDWSSDVCSSDLPKPWTPLLEEIKMIVEAAAGCTFNSALLNLYRGNRDSIGFHSDDEKELGIEPTIASVSFGHERTFILKPKFNRPGDTHKLRPASRSEERREGKGWVSTFRSRWSPDHKKKNNKKHNRYTS